MNFFKNFSAGITIGTLGLFLVACGQEEEKKAPPVPLVTAVTVKTHEIPITYEYAGRIVAYKETEVRARVGGILLRRNFVEGARVHEKDILFEIDPATYEAEVARQKALVEQAQANYQQSIRDADRAVELLKQRVQSTSQRDQAIAKRDADAATLQQAKAALRTAELNLEYTKVAAPIGGMTSREAVSEGSLISVGGLLTNITQNDPIYVNFSYTDVEAREIQRLMAAMNARGEKIDNLKVRIRFGDGREYPELGVIDFTSPTLDNQTGTLGVRAVVDNKDGHLVPGQFVRVTVEGLKLNNAMVIPEQALMQDSSGQFVYLVDQNGIVQKRQVEVSRQLPDRSWLLEPVRQADDAKPAGDATGADMQAAQASDAAPAVKAGDAQVKATDKPAAPVMKYVGLNNGDEVVTEGQARIDMIGRQLPPGTPMKVVITTLDGKDVKQPQPAAGQTGEQK